MISNFRFLKSLTIITTIVSVLAFTQVPSARNKITSPPLSDTLFPSGATIAESPNVVAGEQIFTFLGSTVSYRVYVPEGYASAQYRYPVVYLVNGPAFSPDPNDGTDWKVDELLDSLASKGRQKCLVVALSGLPLATGYEDSLAGFLAGEFKPYFDKTYRTQPQQSVIAGTGAYADVALITSLTRSGKFPRVGVFSPSDSLSALMEARGLNAAGFSGMIFIYKNGSRKAGLLADNLAAHSSALLYTCDKQHATRPATPFGGWFSEFYCWVTGNGFNYVINTKN